MPSTTEDLARIASAPPARRRLTRRRKGRRGISSIIGTIFFVLIVLLTFSILTIMFNSFVTYTTTVNSADQHAAQAEQTSVSVSGYNFGSSTSATTVTTSNSLALSYVPITLTNSQTSATPNPFQQKITWNPTAYASYEASDLGNVRFCGDSACNTQLYAWLESNTGTLATSWVKLTTSIAANGGTMTIYMVFRALSVTFDDNYWGEAPTLSPSYGQYDNGANVFNLYDNFAGTTLGATWTSVTRFASYTVNNGITFTTTRTTSYVFIYSATKTYPQVVDAYMTSVAGDSPMLGVETSSTNNGLGMFNGYSLQWYTGTDSLCPETSAGKGTCVTRSVSSFPSGVWSVYWGAARVEGGTDGAGNALTSTDNSFTIANYGIYLGVSQDGTGSNVVQWARMRAYPPNNVMPGVALGTFVAGEATPTTFTSERKLVSAQGLWWTFYSDGTNIGYCTSPDGSTWSAETIVTSSSGSTRGGNFNVWLSGSTLYYILTPNTLSPTKSFLWRYGTLQTSGSISWSIAETSVSTTNNVYTYNSLAVDNSGNVWAALNTNDGTNTHIEVWEYSSGVWIKVNDISPLPSDATPILVPLSTGVALIYGAGTTTASTSIITTTTGSSWTSALSPTSNYMLLSSSATSIGNTVYFVGLGSTSTGVTSGQVEFWSYTSGAVAVSSETVIQSSSSTWQATISEEQPRTLIIFYGSGTSLYETDSESLGGLWDQPATISTGETAIIGLTSTYSNAGVLWTSGSTAPFNVRFSGFSTLTVVNNSPFPIHMISLYLFNSNANTLVHFDTNPSGSGVSGAFDYWLGAGETMSIPIEPFAWSTSQSYLITIATDQGILSSYSLTSPS